MTLAWLGAINVIHRVTRKKNLRVSLVVILPFVSRLFIWILVERLYSKTTMIILTTILTKTINLLVLIGNQCC